MAMKIGPNEFVQLVEHVAQMLAKENNRVGSLRITGRLIKVPPRGEAIIIGDLHGDMESLGHILENTRFIKKAHAGENILMIFLGDYGDRGIYSPEVYYIVLWLKEQFPENVVLMRGNHEGPDDLLAYPHDLPVQLDRKFGEDGLKVYRKIRELFNHLYNAVLVEGRLVMLHGGAPSQVSTIEDLAYAHIRHPRETYLEEILWSDPIESVRGTYPSPRGAGRLFGEDITDNLLKMLNVKVLIRGHEPSKGGFKINHSGKVLTLFSRKGPPYHNDYGAYLHLDLSQKIESTEHLLKYIHKF
jgi:diadenosine tetraphosphatase ApaH/serine/threonine PP2A family protein phosphatase